MSEYQKYRLFARNTIEQMGPEKSMEWAEFIHAFAKLLAFSGECTEAENYFKESLKIYKEFSAEDNDIAEIYHLKAYRTALDKFNSYI